ncbi:MAG: efflux RND transporter periplasmic adaptor subunit [Proteobacteria bacterium]|nr:efflux RND transporter periplasmic adaptor subunit [Pseudomonadota bacterium]
MNKRMKIMIIALSVVFGGIVGFNFLKTYMIKRFFANFSPPAVNVASIQVEEKDWYPTISAVGNFVAINGVDINAQSSGNITNIHFESGQYLEKDSPLIDIDDRVEEATLKFNKAELVLKELNYKRQQDLFKRGAVSSSVLDESTASLEQAKANVERSEAEVLKKHILTPFAGQLGIRQVNLGQYITPGQSVVVTLQSLDPLYLEFYLPEELAKKLEINQPLHFSREEFPDYLFEGQITAINSKVDTNTHNILVQATLANCPLAALKDPKTTLAKAAIEKASGKTIIRCSTEQNKQNQTTQYAFIPGMFAAIKIKEAAIPKVIALPSTAISYSLYGNSVFLIKKDKEAKDKAGKPVLHAERRFIETAGQEGNYTLIKKGLKSGDLIVSAGEFKLQNGTTVVINNEVKLDNNLAPNKMTQ